MRLPWKGRGPCSLTARQLARLVDLVCLREAWVYISTKEGSRFDLCLNLVHLCGETEPSLPVTTLAPCGSTTSPRASLQVYTWLFTASLSYSILKE